MLATCTGHPTLDLITGKVQYFVYRTHRKAPHYAVSSSPLFSGPSLAKKSSSAPYPQTPSAYIPPSI